jgi:hypothetical protein
MALLEYDQTWTFTSTGAGAWADCGFATYHTFQFEADAASSGAFVIETRRKSGTSTAEIMPSLSVNGSTAATWSAGAAFYQIRPRVTDITGTVKVQGQGIS